MQFFTMDWWCGVQEGLTTDPAADYFAHLDALRERVPPERRPTLDKLLSLALHDARLLQIRVDSAAAELRLRLESYGGDEQLILVYRHVEQYVSVADAERSLCGSCGYGDLGYDEVDALPDGAFVHRILYSSGIEMAVVFHEFELQRDSAAEADAGA